MFSSHPKSKFWNNHKNNGIDPWNVRLNCNKKFWFTCHNCFHDFDRSPNKINRGDWCPYCSNHKLCDIETCDFCKNKSFAIFPKVKNWSNKNTLKPLQVFLNSHQEIWFNCDICEHDFCKRASSFKTCWCPYCSHQKLCENLNCQMCLNMSFASNPKSVFLSDNVDPRFIFKNSNSKKYNFICIKKHIFSSTLDNICKGNWCLICSKSNYSPVSINWLNIISIINNSYIQHAENIGEYKIPNTGKINDKRTQLRADGFCFESNTIYLFHGTKYHGDPRFCNPNDFNYLGQNYRELYKRTIENENLIRSLGYSLVIMWEYDWKVRNTFIKLINRRFIKQENI
jgi:hypothetical protein